MIGSQSFHGYYAIKTKKYWVVESNYTNNATYIFDENWEKYVKLTKQEVINNDLCIQRLYHNENGEAILHRLDLKKIIISTGSACDSVVNQLSHVIMAIKVPKKYASGTIRVSFGKNNNEDKVKIIADEIVKNKNI